MAYNFYVNLAYLLGAVGFVWGLRLLSSPDSARRGNFIAGLGMGLSIIAALFAPMEGAANNYGWIVGAMAVGAIVGYLAAKKVKMTAMPQMVSIFNGLGGACAVVLAGVELYLFYHGKRMLDTGGLVIILLTLLIGAVAFTGSMLAYAKLEGLVDDRKVTFRGHNIVNNIMLLVTVGLGVWLCVEGKESGTTLPIVVGILALIYGFSFVAPIGGADSVP